MNAALSAALAALAAGGDLSAESAEAAVDALLTGETSEAAVAAFLTALRVKGETAEELAGAVRAVRGRVADSGLLVSGRGLVDTCGTGGDGAHTVNVSTAAAIVVAACGVPVAKHGNRAASGNSGSAEVLDELGIKFDAEPAVLSRCLAELGITFLFAPKFHPGLRGLAAVRRQLPFRTIFNLVGPLANPARPEFQLVGVAGEPQAQLVAHALARLETTTRAAVVTGANGLDEVSLDGPTRVLLVERHGVTERRWLPSDFGLGTAPVSELRVIGPSDSAEKIRQMFRGDRGAVRDVILANAAAALWVVSGDGGIGGAVARAADAVDSGRAARLLDAWGKLSHGPV